MRVASLFGVILAFAIPALGQDAPTPTARAQLILTLGHLYGEASPALTQSELTVSHDYSPLPITKLTPLTGDRAGLDMFLLVDDCSNCELGPKFQELQRFIVAQPSTTLIGVAYIEGGKLKIATETSADREQTLKALSAPTGGNAANPFDPLETLITSWKSSATRRVIVLISNGIDPAAKEIMNASVEKATAAAQRSGVQLYAIYNPSANYLSTDFDEIYTGQVHLAHVAEETGGEAYLLTSGPLPSLAPFLEDIAGHLANQYLLEFLVTPGETSGFQELTIKSKVRKLELLAPAQVWVAGRGASDREPGR